MNHLSFTFAGCAVAIGLAMPAGAAGVHVEIRGTVDYNVIRGDLNGIPSGAPVVLGFDLDSTKFVDNPNYPTRGYLIDLASFDMNFGGVHIGLDNPQPYGDAYFVLRDNDPAVDGFFMSQGNLDYPMSLTIHVPGLAPEHEFDFLRTFDNATTLHSLDILDATGTYGFENMSSYLWTIGRFGNPGAEVMYESISITAVPEPSTLTLFGIGALVALRRARRA